MHMFYIGIILGVVHMYRKSVFPFICGLRSILIKGNTITFFEVCFQNW